MNKINNPVIYAVAGGPAAGKTSYRINAINNGIFPNDAFIHDCDAVMQALPGYQEHLAAHGSVRAFKQWELPARELAEQQLQQQVSAKQNIIYDRSCALPSSFEFIKELVSTHGYQLIMHLLYVDSAEAKKRARIREEQSGRHTPESLINERIHMLSTLWPRYLSFASEAYLLDNSYPDPRQVAAFKNNKLEIHDPVIYKSFLAAYE